MTERGHSWSSAYFAQERLAGGGAGAEWSWAAVEGGHTAMLFAKSASAVELTAGCKGRDHWRQPLLAGDERARAGPAPRWQARLAKQAARVARSLWNGGEDRH